MIEKLRVLYRIGVLVAVVLLVALACNMPGAGVPGDVEDAVETAGAVVTEIAPQAEEAAQILQETAQAMAETSVAATAAVMLQEQNPEELVEQAEELAEGVTELIPGGETSSEPDVNHEDTPQEEAGKSLAAIPDINTQPSGNQKHAKEGDVYDTNLWERPFDAEMNYRPDLDIQKAEIGSDGKFAYVTIYLQAIDSATQALYGVELDTDIDGRGDYLLLSSVPSSTEWGIAPVSMYVDTNDDVGGQHAMRSNAPSSGDGYDTLIFSAEQYSDPDAAWARLAPTANNAIQFAIKLSVLDSDNFLWSVLADDGWKDPKKFDYNDVVKLADAGSPLDGHESYPLKDLYAIDNTCRMTFKREVTGLEPGLCGDAAVMEKPSEQQLTQTVPAVLPTVDGIELPSLP